MKDLEGGFGIEKKCVTGIFLGCFGFFGGKWGGINEFIVFFTLRHGG
jgi:hypothetical protein